MAEVYAKELLVSVRITFANKQTSICLGVITLASKIEENYFKAKVYEVLEVLPFPVNWLQNLPNKFVDISIAVRVILDKRSIV